MVGYKRFRYEIYKTIQSREQTVKFINKAIYEKQISLHEQRTNIELQAPDFGQAHKDCDVV